MADLPVHEKPRERLRVQGAQALATSELLAIIVGSGQRGANALEIGAGLLARFGLAGIAGASTEELCEVRGCGPATALRLQAATELGRRVVARPEARAPRIQRPADAAELLLPAMAHLEQEHLRVMMLNTKNRVIGVHEVYKGSVNASLVRTGEVFREAVRRNAPAIIVIHNHPSGDPAPSPEDVRVTGQLAEAGRLLDIELLDHLIIGDNRWVSLRERGIGFG